VTNASPFNSQTALIVEKFPGGVNKISSNHYYAENLRNNHQKALNESKIYDPLDKGQDVDYKQLDPLLPSEQNPSIKVMGSQEEKLSKDMQESIQMPDEFPKEAKPSHKFTNQVSF
jgi:hypothetical protein